jgi:hypothetical protein
VLDAAVRGLRDSPCQNGMHATPILQTERGEVKRARRAEIALVDIDTTSVVRRGHGQRAETSTVEQARRQPSTSPSSSSTNVDSVLSANLLEP